MGDIRKMYAPIKGGLGMEGGLWILIHRDSEVTTPRLSNSARLVVARSILDPVSSFGEEGNSLVTVAELNGLRSLPLWIL